MKKSKSGYRSKQELAIETIDLFLQVGEVLLKDYPEIYSEIESHLNRRIEEIMMEDWSRRNNE